MPIHVWSIALLSAALYTAAALDALASWWAPHGTLAAASITMAVTTLARGEAVASQGLPRLGMLAAMSVAAVQVPLAIPGGGILLACVILVAALVTYLLHDWITAARRTTPELWGAALAWLLATGQAALALQPALPSWLSVLA